MPKQTFNLQKAFEELEKLNVWFTNEDIDLDEGLKKFKRGMELIKKSQKRLKDVENEFEEIKKDMV